MHIIPKARKTRWLTYERGDDIFHSMTPKENISEVQWFTTSIGVEEKDLYK
jgi:hypothetical protein